MERYFNTAGPCIPAKHYKLPALDRLPGILRLVNIRIATRPPVGILHEG